MKLTQHCYIYYISVKKMGRGGGGETSLMVQWLRVCAPSAGAQVWSSVRKLGEGDDGGQDGWMASPTGWTWVWAWLGGGEGQGILACCSQRVIGLQRVRHNWATKGTRSWSRHRERRSCVPQDLAETNQLKKKKVLLVCLSPPIRKLWPKGLIPHFPSSPHKETLV